MAGLEKPRRGPLTARSEPREELVHCISFGAKRCTSWNFAAMEASGVVGRGYWRHLLRRTRLACFSGCGSRKIDFAASLSLRRGIQALGTLETRTRGADSSGVAIGSLRESAKLVLAVGGVSGGGDSLSLSSATGVVGGGVDAWLPSLPFPEVRLQPSVIDSETNSWRTNSTHQSTGAGGVGSLLATRSGSTKSASKTLGTVSVVSSVHTASSTYLIVIGFGLTCLMSSIPLHSPCSLRLTCRLYI